MKLALIFFFVLTSLSMSVNPQGTPPITCRGKPLSIKMLPGPILTGPRLPLRFGGTRQFPLMGFPSDTSARQTIKNRDELNDAWNLLGTRTFVGKPFPPPPEIDFSKEMIVSAAMGERPTSGYWIVIDGACEVDGRVEVFVSSVEGTVCEGHGQFPTVTYPADAVLIPQTNLPVVFRETQLSCKQWHKEYVRWN